MVNIEIQRACSRGGGRRAPRAPGNRDARGSPSAPARVGVGDDARACGSGCPAAEVAVDLRARLRHLETSRRAGRIALGARPHRSPGKCGLRHVAGPRAVSMPRPARDRRLRPPPRWIEKPRVRCALCADGDRGVRCGGDRDAPSAAWRGGGALCRPRRAHERQSSDETRNILTTSSAASPARARRADALDAERGMRGCGPSAPRSPRHFVSRRPITRCLAARASRTNASARAAAVSYRAEACARFGAAGGGTMSEPFSLDSVRGPSDCSARPPDAFSSDDRQPNVPAGLAVRLGRGGASTATTSQSRVCARARCFVVRGAQTPRAPPP